MAVFGTVYLSLDKLSGAHPSVAHASASALSCTLVYGFAVLAALGVLGGAVLSRTILQASRRTARQDKELAVQPRTT